MSSTDTSPAQSAPDKSQPTKKLPTFRVGFAKQLDALRGYAVISDGGTKPVHYSKVADLIKVHEANVSSMNPFFLENGFIEKSGGMYLPAPAILEYNRQHSWNAETAARKLAPIVLHSWFGRAILQRLQFRTMSEDEAIEALAAECMAGPTAKPQLRMLIDYCDAAGILARANGQLTAAVVGETTPHQHIESPEADAPRQEPAVPEPMIAPKVATNTGAGGINFSVAVDVNLADMKDWSPDRITAFFAGIAQVLAAKNG